VVGADLLTASMPRGAEWAGYDESARRDILAALAAQTRLALAMPHDKPDTKPDTETGIDCAATPRSLRYAPEMIAATCGRSARKAETSPHH
jgi:hypothetical protein